MLDFDPNSIKFGPLNKNLFTKELELIAKIALRNPDDCRFYSVDNTFFATLGDIRVDISHLLEHANLTHVLLDEEDSHLFFNKLHMRDYFTNRNFDDGKSDVLPEEYSELTLAELSAITNFKASGYKAINSVLSGKYAKYCCTQKDFLTIMFLASGMNKIIYNSYDNKIIYRGDSTPDFDEIGARLDFMESHPEGILVPQPRFSSTSIYEQTAQSFAESTVKIKIEFDAAYGKYIEYFRGALNYKDEGEFLIPPCHFHFKSFKLNQEPKEVVFKASVLTPLIEEPMPTDAEQAEFNAVLMFSSGSASSSSSSSSSSSADSCSSSDELGRSSSKHSRASEIVESSVANSSTPPDGPSLKKSRH